MLLLDVILTITELLLVAETDLALVVDLSTDASILVQVVLGAHAKLGSIRARSPGQLHGSLQTIVASLVDQTTELTAIITVLLVEEKNQRKSY